MRLKLSAGRAEKDSEKAVIPALIYVGCREPYGYAHSLSLGWWDWYVRVTFLGLYK